MAIASPTGGNVSGSAVAVSATASDNVGVARVELRVNGTTVATDTSSPYAFTWNSTTLANGAATLTAVAFDAAGNSTTSAAVAVNIANAPPGDTSAPSVGIASPSAGNTLTGQVKVAVNASDNVGVTRADFRVNGVTQATSNAAPFVFPWASTLVPDGAAALTAVAFDATGNSATSAAVNVTIANPPPPGTGGDTAPPQVAIASPTGGDVKGVVAVLVSARDNVGVARVDFRVNGTKVATATVSPYQFAWNTSLYADGAANLSAVAYDAAGNTATSSTVTVNVTHASTGGTDILAPTLAVTNPINGAMVSGVVSIKASATDNSGAAGIRQTLYIDSVQKATVSGAALNYNWNTKRVSSGKHTILVTARDAAGNSASKQIQVTRK